MRIFLSSEHPRCEEFASWLVDQGYSVQVVDAPTSGDLTTEQLVILWRDFLELDEI